jgi:hypothetical protein
MARVMPDWQRQSLGQSGAARCVAVRRPRAGWMMVHLAVVAGQAREERRSLEV